MKREDIKKIFPDATEDKAETQIISLETITAY